VTDDHDYKPYLDAVKQGFLKESEIDTPLVRLFTARMKLGMFDPPEMVPYARSTRSSAGQRRASRHGPQAGQRVDGAAEERRRAAAEDFGHQDRCGRPARRSDKGAAGQLQRNSDAHGLDSGGPAEGKPVQVQVEYAGEKRHNAGCPPGVVQG
jgi:hypothetical protein